MRQGEALSYLFLGGCLGQSRTSLDGGISGLRPVGSHLKFGAARGMLEVEGIELLSDPLQNDASLQTLVVARRILLSLLPPLLLGLLRTRNSLFPQGRLEALELGAGHCGRCFFESTTRPLVTKLSCAEAAPDTERLPSPNELVAKFFEHGLSIAAPSVKWAGGDKLPVDSFPKEVSGDLALIQELIHIPSKEASTWHLHTILSLRLRTEKNHHHQQQHYILTSYISLMWHRRKRDTRGPTS